MIEAVQTCGPDPKRRHIAFVDHVTADQTALMTFTDPSPRYAVETVPPTGSAPDAHTLSLVILPLAPASSSQRDLATRPLGTAPIPRPPITVTSRRIKLNWQPGEAVIECEPAEVDDFLRAVVEFTHYEAELTTLERETASVWHELEQDKSLAFRVTKADLARGAIIGTRMDLVLSRRIRLARIESHLVPDVGLSAAAKKLGLTLREKANTETRLETVGDQLEVFEDIYEMGSQRLGEFRASSQEHTLEWVIIVLLAAETLLMGAQALWHFGT